MRRDWLLRWGLQQAAKMAGELSIRCDFPTPFLVALGGRLI